MPVDLVLRNAKVYAYGEVTQAGLAIDRERIVKIAKETNLPPASREMNLGGLLVLPGLIDAHVHLRDQEQAYKEDFFTGTSAAAKGGVTLVIDMPNNRPVTMDPSTLRERMNIAAEKSIVNVAFYSAFPEKTREIQTIVKKGAKAFKLYMQENVGGLNSSDDQALIKAFAETAKLNVPVAVHAEDKDLLEHMLNEAKQRADNDLGAHSKAHSPKVEAKAIERVVKITEESNADVHICHVSTGIGMKIISSAKQDGLPMTCEVTPHHLLLSSCHLKTCGGIALTNPPLRSEEDTRSLWSALESGSVDILVSDHAPHAFGEKEKDSVWEVAAGISGLETLLPLMLAQVSKGRLTLSNLVEMTSERPAEIFALRDRGCLKEGNYADIVAVDLKEEWKIDSSKFCSKAKFSPFDGWRVKGRARKVLVNGHLVMDEDEIVGKPGDGAIIR